MTTEEAFVIFLNAPELVGKTDLSPVHKRALRLKLKAGQLKHDTMERWLTQAGFKESITWKAPKGYGNKKAAAETAAV